MRTVGVVVNPISGMGGRVGLKGTDGKVEEARDRGAEPRAPDRARMALTAMADAGDVAVVTWGPPMGADVVAAAGLSATVLGSPSDPATTADDTRDAVRTFIDHGVDLVLFVGGDGTAVDVAETLEAAGAIEDIPILGVPAGVKVFSEVFAVRPEAAGRIAATFTDTEPAEVNDLDESAYRSGTVRSELRAVVRVPVAEERQSSKQLDGGDISGLVDAVAEEIRADPDGTYVLGPGGTVGTIAEALGVEGSPLGVDVYRDGTLVVRDGGASAIEASLVDPVTIVVSPIGGQGFLFGRGNLQLSPAVIRRAETIEIVASRSKLDGLGVLRVDTGDPTLDEELRGFHRVRIGRFEHRLVEIR